MDGSTYIEMAKRMPQIFDEEMTAAGEEASKAGQDMIETSGTARSWSGAFQGRTGSGSGRVDTGEMRDLFSFRVIHGRGVGLDVGWVKGYEEYFGAQDRGFLKGGFRPSQVVKGMGVMARVQVEVRAKVDDAIDRSIKRITDGL